MLKMKHLVKKACTDLYTLYDSKKEPIRSFLDKKELHAI